MYVENFVNQVQADWMLIQYSAAKYNVECNYTWTY